MLKCKSLIFFCLTLCLILPQTGMSKTKSYEKIVILGGSVGEIISELGLQDKVIAVDTTSSVVKNLEKKKVLGMAPQINAEAVMALKPDLIVYGENSQNKKLLEQLDVAKIPSVKIAEPNTLESIQNKVTEVSKVLGQEEKGVELNKKIAADLSELQKKKHDFTKMKVAFIYARGSNQIFLAGKDTPADAMIRELGASNAFATFSGFKPVSSEGLIQANPEYLIMLESGVKSLNNNVWDIPGLSHTLAGQHKRLIEVETLPFLGFVPRTPKQLMTLIDTLAVAANEKK